MEADGDVVAGVVVAAYDVAAGGDDTWAPNEHGHVVNEDEAGIASAALEVASEVEDHNGKRRQQEC